MNKKTVITILILLLICIGIAVYPLMINENSDFGGADRMILSYIRDYYMTCPLSSRHFLWTPVMQHKHNGLPSGFVLS